MTTASVDAGVSSDVTMFIKMQFYANMEQLGAATNRVERMESVARNTGCFLFSSYDMKHIYTVVCVYIYIVHKRQCNIGGKKKTDLMSDRMVVAPLLVAIVTTLIKD